MDIKGYLNSWVLPDDQSGSGLGQHFIPSDGEAPPSGSVVIIGITGQHQDTEHIRAVVLELASYHLRKVSVPITYLGELVPGSTDDDTLHGLSHVVEELIRNRCAVIVLGGRQHFSHAHYQAFARMETTVNLCSFNPRCELSEGEPDAYVARIVRSQPNFLFNYSLLGFQTYYVHPATLDLANDLYFDQIRLGELRQNLSSAEPVIRYSDVVSISANTIKRSEFGASLTQEPNGLSNEEVCHIARFCGLADRLKIFALTDIDWKRCRAEEIKFIAQCLWCFVEGLNFRNVETPSAGNSAFVKYRIPVKQSEHEIVFYRSLATERWWMEVPVPPQFATRYSRQCLVPCSYSDYVCASRDELPDRWWNTYRKMM